MGLEPVPAEVIPLARPGAPTRPSPCHGRRVDPPQGAVQQSFSLNKIVLVWRDESRGTTVKVAVRLPSGKKKIFTPTRMDRFPYNRSVEGKNRNLSICERPRSVQNWPSYAPSKLKMAKTLPGRISRAIGRREMPFF